MALFLVAGLHGRWQDVLSVASQCSKIALVSCIAHESSAENAANEKRCHPLERCAVLS
jgi:hypothetical protein